MAKKKQKKKYRIYKAGGSQGKVLNPTAQFLAKADNGIIVPTAVPKSKAIDPKVAAEQEATARKLQFYKLKEQDPTMSWKDEFIRLNPSPASVQVQEGGQPMSQEEMMMMQQQQAQPSAEERQAMILNAIKEAIMQNAPAQEVLDFMVQNQIVEDLAQAAQVYKQIKDEMVNAGQVPGDMMAEEEMMAPEMMQAEEGMETQSIQSQSTTNDIPIGGRQEKLNEFVSTVQATSNKAKEKEIMAQQANMGPVGENPFIARDGLSLGQRRTNRRIARFADQMSPKLDMSDRRRIRRALNRGEMNMGDVFSEANMPSFTGSENDLVQTIDPETGSRIFVRNRKGLFGKLKQDIYAENVGLSDLLVPFGTSRYATGVYGSPYGSYGYSDYIGRGSEIYYTDPVTKTAAVEINDKNIPEKSEVNSGSTSATSGTSTTSSTSSSGSSRRSSSSKGKGTSSSAGSSKGSTSTNQISKEYNNAVSLAENSKLLNLVQRNFLNSSMDQARSGLRHSGNLDALSFMYPGEPSGSSLDLEFNPIYQQLKEQAYGIDTEALKAMDVDNVLNMIGDDPTTTIDELQEYMSLFPSNSPEAIAIQRYITAKNAEAAQLQQQATKEAAKTMIDPTAIYKNKTPQQKLWENLKLVWNNRPMFSRLWYNQDGGYIDSTNPDLYKFTGGGDYFADGGAKDTTDPYLVQAEGGIEMMSEQPKPGETMKDYFIRTGRQDQLQYISPEQQAQVYNEGTADVADIDDPYKNTENTYGAWTKAGDIDAANKSIEEQADVTRSITATGQKDRDIDATKAAAEKEGYYGPDKMNFMSRYEAWKRGGRSQDVNNLYGTRNQTSDGELAYGSGKDFYDRGFGFFDTTNRKAISRLKPYFTIKGVELGPDGKPLPIDINEIAKIRTRVGKGPYGRFKQVIKFNQEDKDKKDGFFSDVTDTVSETVGNVRDKFGNFRDKAGNLFQGFRSRRRDRNQPSPQPSTFQTNEPTYQQQIEGDGREFDEMILGNQNQQQTTNQQAFTNPIDRTSEANRGRDRAYDEIISNMRKFGGPSLGYIPELVLGGYDPSMQYDSKAANKEERDADTVDNMIFNEDNLENLSREQLQARNERLLAQSEDEMQRRYDEETPLPPLPEEEKVQRDKLVIKEKNPFLIDGVETGEKLLTLFGKTANIAQKAITEGTPYRQTMKQNIDEEFNEVPKRGLESLNTRLQTGDSGAKFEMIKGQNKTKYGGWNPVPYKEGEVYDLTFDEIKNIMAAGGSIEFIYE
jgi:hypothetical protein